VFLYVSSSKSAEYGRYYYTKIIVDGEKGFKYFRIDVYTGEVNEITGDDLDVAHGIQSARG
jgi:hypothetical protein